MTTTVTPDYFLKCLDRWGVNWRFYSNKADWLTHNRNAAGNNQVTPGGFGPLRGVVAHNTASTSQTGMLTYLYNGDAARALPGPLCNWAVLKTGEVVLMGWGTSNATGPGDPKADALVRKNALPMDRELVPTTAGPADPNAVLYAPYYLGWEACHAAEGPTAAQYQAIIRAACAALDAMGGPAQSYSGGSVPMHRELTTTRSDPQGVGKAQIRRDIDKQFAAGPPTQPKPPEPPVQKKPSTVSITPDRDAITKGETVALSLKAMPAQPGTHILYYKTGAMTSWQEWSRQKTKDGSAKVPNSPVVNVSYMTSWWPDDPAFEDSVAAYATVSVVDLVRLMTEHRQALADIRDLQDRVAKLENPQAPTPVQQLAPGDTP